METMKQKQNNFENNAFTHGQNMELLRLSYVFTPCYIGPKSSLQQQN